ncbi:MULTISPECIES: hypothetical protein [unclassified Halomonas]|uniref:hypothetical protein n=1 Tax=unclassified Halomonas TaxID=2609666 RepID=UPI0005F9CE6F|nr:MULTISPECIES: hypothetical protein [unclassified Halomonas]KJZ04277.1 hypothetical protein TW86_22375 [Halomonas sp. S2151]MCO7216523.1 hypothetical protein [Halomonas sp. OfavH-34-E]
MATETRKKYFNTRIERSRGEQIDEWAKSARRSFTQEVLLLIDQGIAWRKKHGNTVPQPHEGQ